MTKYRIVESYRHKYHDLETPGYLIQTPDKDGKWKDLDNLSYSSMDSAIHWIQYLKKLEEAKTNGEKIVYETEF